MLTMHQAHTSGDTSGKSGVEERSVANGQTVQHGKGSPLAEESERRNFGNIT